MMDIRTALKHQYKAGLESLSDCVRACPDEMWSAGDYPRYTWRIVFHTAFFTHLYLGQDLAAFRPWSRRREGIHEGLWETPEWVEPFELPDGVEAYSKEEMLAYIAYVTEMVDAAVDALDLETEESGFEWYPSTSKMAHQLVNVRHIQGHVGQLTERLLSNGIDIEW